MEVNQQTNPKSLSQRRTQGSQFAPGSQVWVQLLLWGLLVSTARSEPPAAVSPAARSPWLCLQTSPLIKASEPRGKSQLQNGWESFISKSGFTLQIILMINTIINIKYFLKHLAGKKKSRTPSFPPIPPQKSHKAEGLGSNNAVGDEHLHTLSVCLSELKHLALVGKRVHLFKGDGGIPQDPFLSLQRDWERREDEETGNVKSRTSRARCLWSQIA